MNNIVKMVNYYILHKNADDLESIYLFLCGNFYIALDSVE